MEEESDGDTCCNWCAWYSHPRINTRVEGLRNERTIGKHLNDSILKINQNTEECRGHLMGLAVT